MDMMKSDSQNDHWNAIQRVLTVKSNDNNYITDSVNFETSLVWFYFVVLSDEHKRAIYDTTGIKGLETEGWEVSTLTTVLDMSYAYTDLVRKYVLFPKDVNLEKKLCLNMGFKILSGN